MSPTESFLYTYRTYKDYKSIQCCSKTGYDCFGVVENMSTSFIHHLFSYVLVPYRLPVTVQLYNKSEVIKIPIYNYRYLVWSLFFFVIKILLWNKSNFLLYNSFFCCQFLSLVRIRIQVSKIWGVGSGSKLFSFVFAPPVNILE